MSPGVIPMTSILSWGRLREYAVYGVVTMVSTPPRDVASFTISRLSMSLITPSTPPLTSKESMPPNPVICGALEDRVVTVPIEANFDGMTYGIGTVLAGGWQGWFVSVPIVFTYSDMDDNTTEGIVTTVAPRGGRVVGLGRYGNLAFYAGGQYLKTELDVSGTFEFGDTGLAVDYKIRQQNKDRWATTFGGNWSINKHWSWTLEYSGFTGSRDNVVTSVSLRF